LKRILINKDKKIQNIYQTSENCKRKYISFNKIILTEQNINLFKNNWNKYKKVIPNSIKIFRDIYKWYYRFDIQLLEKVYKLALDKYKINGEVMMNLNYKL
jgi:hypothetical protein